jgi:predicted DNA-binding transcriptional regulator AlpA
LTKTGKLPAVRIGRAVRYDPGDVAEFIEACKDEGGGS